jgi:NO-binding membrane sensor protein with MHYT domain
MGAATATYDLPLVFLSYAISVFGAYTALQLAVAIPAARGRALWGWLIGAAVAMGGGAIWSMHFIAMLAYQMPMQVRYDPALTLASLVVAILVTGTGLYVVGRGQASATKLVGGGLFTGLGVGAMHYTGMAAMVMPATLSYRPSLFVLSLVIAVVASIAALWLAFNLRGNWQMFGSAFVMGAAVCGMHYTGMAAAIITPTDQPGMGMPLAVQMSAGDLALYVAVITAVLLTIALVVVLRRSRRDLLYET